MYDRDNCVLCNQRLNGGLLQKYCSNACRQRAYRLRIDADCGSTTRRRDRAGRAARSRQSTTIRYTCKACGLAKTKTNAEGNRVFCSDTCRQKSHRAKKTGT